MIKTRKNVLEKVCREIVQKERFILGRAFDGSDLLVRKRALTPVHRGGVHSVGDIAQSMTLSRSLQSKRIILLDDLVFSGRTDLACRKLLKEAGAEEVFSVCMYGYNRPTTLSMKTTLRSAQTRGTAFRWMLN